MTDLNSTMEIKSKTHVKMSSRDFEPKIFKPLPNIPKAALQRSEEESKQLKSEEEFKQPKLEEESEQKKLEEESELLNLEEESEHLKVPGLRLRLSSGEIPLPPPSPESEGFNKARNLFCSVDEIPLPPPIESPTEELAPRIDFTSKPEEIPSSTDLKFKGLDESDVKESLSLSSKSSLGNTDDYPNIRKESSIDSVKNIEDEPNSEEIQQQNADSNAKKDDFSESRINDPRSSSLHLHRSRDNFDGLDEAQTNESEENAEFKVASEQILFSRDSAPQSVAPSESRRSMGINLQNTSDSSVISERKSLRSGKRGFRKNASRMKNVNLPHPRSKSRNHPVDSKKNRKWVKKSELHKVREKIHNSEENEESNSDDEIENMNMRMSVRLFDEKGNMDGRNARRITLFTRTSDLNVFLDFKDEVESKQDESLNETTNFLSEKEGGRSSDSSIPKYLRKRLFILQEWLETEESFVNKLDDTIKFFIRPLAARTCLKSVPEILCKSHISHIFMNIEALYLAHESFYQDLKELSRKNWEPSQVIVVLEAHLLKLEGCYLQYHISFDNSDALLRHVLSKSPSFTEFVKVAEYCTQYPLTSLLIEPIQRLPRYVLLLKELISTFPETDDHNVLEKLHEINHAFQVVVKNVEETSKQSDGSQRIIWIENILLGGTVELQSPTRILIREGMLNYVHTSKSLFFRRSPSPYLFILFNDWLIWVSHKQYPAKWKGDINLENLEILDVSEDLSSQDPIDRNEEDSLISSVSEMNQSTLLKFSGSKSSLDQKSEKGKSAKFQSAFFKILGSNPSGSQDESSNSTLQTTPNSFKSSSGSSGLIVIPKRTFILKNKSKEIILMASTAAEKHQWMDAIRSAVSAYSTKISKDG